MITFYQKQDWLESHGYQDGDVMIDDFGREYVYTVDEDGVRTKLFIEDEITAQ